MKTPQKEYLQSAMFGFNDALVSTTGVIVGISTGTGDKQIVILAGIVTILVEALSVHQLNKLDTVKVPIVSGLIMFCAYFLAGLVPLLTIIVTPISYARNAAIVAALFFLLILGYAKGKIVKVSPLRSALEVFVIGGITTAIGIAAGRIFAI